MNTDYTPQILNRALELTTEWGENFHKPIDERMLTDHPDLTANDIAALTALARETESFIYSLAERELAGEIREADIVPEARQKYAWLDDDNAFRLKSIGMFYARK